MIKRLLYLFLGGILLLGFTQCAGTSSKGITVKGKITDASNLRIFFDKLPIGSQKVEVLSQSDIGTNGKFTITTETPVEPGIYRVRVGGRNVMLILEGGEKVVEMTGSMSDMESGDMVIKGSDESAKALKLTGKLNKKEVGIAEVRKEMNNFSNPLTSLMFAMGTINETKEDVALLKGLVSKLRERYPKSDYTVQLDNMTTSMERNIMASESAQLVKEGAEAPNISLPNPDGKVIELKSLRGKVVLLDFWASWCGPCRRENPNVVSVYNKYKDKGFTVYSVSLDRPGGMENWKAAIAADKLAWPNHVSDLQHWNSVAGKTYGIDAIPRAYLLDKEGKIAGINLRGEALEPAVKRLL